MSRFVYFYVRCCSVGTGILLALLPLAACSDPGGQIPAVSQEAAAIPTGAEASRTDAVGSAAASKTVEQGGDAYTQQRLRMVADTIESREVKDPQVLEAMRAVPRHEFVPAEYLDQAYDDHPLPIGYGQTISQPFIVAWMTELLELEPGDKVLEIGTGSGYQAAVLAEMGEVEVYSIEIVPELAESAAQRLEALGYGDLQVRQGDGYYGWEEYAPFDAIIVTAAPDHLPAQLAEQLDEGGRLVIPIGPPGGYQSLWKFVKESGELKAFNLGGVAFVPFTGAGVETSPLSPTP